MVSSKPSQSVCSRLPGRLPGCLPKLWSPLVIVGPCLDQASLINGSLARGVPKWARLGPSGAPVHIAIIACCCCVRVSAPTIRDRVPVSAKKTAPQGSTSPSVALPLPPNHKVEGGALRRKAVCKKNNPFWFTLWLACLLNFEFGGEGEILSPLLSQVAGVVFFADTGLEGYICPLKVSPLLELISPFLGLCSLSLQVYQTRRSAGD